MHYIDKEHQASKDMPISTPNHSPTVVFGTFGTYRYILACMVIVIHTGPKNWNFAGGYAVFAFFILSGYVVSHILTHTYLPQHNGLWHYARNRALRIFPLYWIAMLLALTITLYYPEKAANIDTFFKLPSSFIPWMHNIIIITINFYTHGSSQYGTLLLPVGWSLSNEIIYWIIIPVALMFPRLQKLLFIYALFYTSYACIVSSDAAFWQKAQYRYFSTSAAALPFSIGLHLFLRKQRKKKPISKESGYIAAVGFLVLLYISACAVFGNIVSTGFYLSIVINTLIISYLSQIDSSTLPTWFQRLDRFLGNLSYPIYLIHMTAGAWLLAMIPKLTVHSVGLTIATMALSTQLAWLLHTMVEEPITRWKRAKDKGTPKTSQNAPAQ